MTEGGGSTAAAPKSKAAQLRAEMRRLCGLVDVLIKALTGTPGSAGKVVGVPAGEAARSKGENGALKGGEQGS